MKIKLSLLTLVAATAFVLAAGPAAANFATAIRVDCNTVEVDLVSFPDTPTPITFSGTVNGTSFTRTETLSGTAGTVSVDISDLTGVGQTYDVVPTVSVTVVASWTLGGVVHQYPETPATFDDKCGTETPPPPPPPPPTVGPQVLANVEAAPGANVQAASSELPRTGMELSLIGFGIVLIALGALLAKTGPPLPTPLSSSSPVRVRRTATTRSTSLRSWTKVGRNRTT